MEEGKTQVQLAYEAYLEKRSTQVSPYYLRTWAQLSEGEKEAWEAAIHAAISVMFPPY